MTKVALIKIQFKIKINGLLSDPFSIMLRVRQGCPLSISYTVMQLIYLPISSTRIKVIQIGDHEIKIVNFVDSTTIFFRDITWLNMIQRILKLHEDAYTLKINFSNAKPYGLEHIKIELINQDKWNGHNFPLKYLELREYWQITFFMLNKFFLLSKTPSQLPVLDKQYQAECNSNQNQIKGTCPLSIVFQVLKVLLTKIYKIQPPVISFLIVLH